jgi:hypothetical protein
MTEEEKLYDQMSDAFRSIFKNCTLPSMEKIIICLDLAAVQAFKMFEEEENPNVKMKSLAAYVGVTTAFEAIAYQELMKRLSND